MRADASADEIRAAYRARARRAHPDVAGGSAASAGMAALNEAWRVLGDPARRRAYDRTLHRPAPVTPDVVAGDDDELAIEAPAGRAGYLVGLPWLLVLAVLAVIFVFTAYATSRSGSSDELDGLVRIGDCVRLRTGHPAAEAPCDDSADAVVDNVLTGAETCPAGSQLALGPVGAERLCLRPS